MTSPVAPPAAPTVPPYPALGSPTFNADAYAYGSAMPAVSAGISALAQNAFTNATAANESAAASAASAAASDASAANALASSNFIGDWAGKTGAINRPASCAHIGRTWMLLADLPNIAAAEPAEGSAYWRAYDVLLPVIPITTAYAELVSGREYSVLYTGGQVTLKMPPPGIGAAVVIGVANKRSDLVLLHNGGLFMDELALDDYTLVDPGRYAARHDGVSWRGLA